MKSNVITLAQLKVQLANQQITYQALLGTLEWTTKRDAIVKRDKEVCTKCGSEPTDNLWVNGKMYHLLYRPYDPNEIVEMGDFKFFGWELSPEVLQANAAVLLHVHHLYYVLSKYPWEYEDSALVTLCNDCHSEVHRVETIPVYKIEKGEREKISGVTCSRCHGAGYFPQYKNVENGVCFQCRGKRYTNLNL